MGLIFRTLTHFGDWGPMEWCSPGYFAYSLTLKIEIDQEEFDDVGLSGLKLHCK